MFIVVVAFVQLPLKSVGEKTDVLLEHQLNYPLTQGASLPVQVFRSTARIGNQDIALRSHWQLAKCSTALAESECLPALWPAGSDMFKKGLSLSSKIEYKKA